MKSVLNALAGALSLKKVSTIIAVTIGIACSIPAGAHAGVARMWAVDDGEKILAEDTANPLATSSNNPVWNGTTVSLFGGRNEIVAFQLLVQADHQGAGAINVTVSDLVNGAGRISNTGANETDPYDYRNKSIELFTEHYLYFPRRSENGWYWASGAKPSDYYLGWIPDCLIPFTARAGKGGAPFDIAANRNQAVWVDISVPRTAPSGVHAGSISVTAGGNVIRTIPLSLMVYNFTIPDETHLHNMFYYERCFIADRHGVSCGSDAFYAIEGRYHQMAHRHRMDLNCMVWDLKIMDKGYKRTLNGQLYTSAYKYQGPGEGIGNRTFSIGPYGELPGEWGGEAGVWSEAVWRTGSDAWETWFETNAPLVERHKYLDPDEPKTDADYARIQQQAQWTHNNPGPGKKIPCYVTDHIHDNLKGYVDYWSISADHFKPSFQQSAAVISAEVAAGRKWGVYNGYRPAFGAVLIDADAIEFRVMPWILWKYKANQYYYWNTTHWQGIRFNLFQDPYTYGDGKYAGDGTFFYPGQDKGFADEDRNLPGPLSSIRMKNWRRGMQDYEYLWLAQKAGLGDSAKAIANACIARALYEADYTRDIPWSKHGYGFEVYRKRLAELLSRQNSTTMLRYNNVDAHIKNRAVVHPTLYINQKNGSPVVRIHCAGNRVFDFRGALVANVRANAYR